MVQSLTTFVFFDIETTGLPDLEFNKTKITELALVACSKAELQNQLTGSVPRVLHKLTLCFNPHKRIDPDSSKITGKKYSSKQYEITEIFMLLHFAFSGLDNYNLEHEKFFSNETGDLVKAFFNQLQAPICLVAHNGFKFDFPILRKQLNTVVNVHLKISGLAIFINSFPWPPI